MATVPQGTKAERFQFIDKHRSEFGLGYLCEWLNVSRSGYYNWCDDTETDRDKSDRELLVHIKRIFFANDTNYGSSRVFKALRLEGFRVGESRVERLMRAHGLVGKAGRIYRQKAWVKPAYTRLKNLRTDLPAPTGIDQQWVADVTYIKVSDKWQYLAVVMDLYSRRILGWSLGSRRTAELVLASLRCAFDQRQKPLHGLIFHTDRGVEYGADLIQEALRRRGIGPSMNRPGYVTDNAHMESFFQSMKTECVTGVSFKNCSELRLTLSNYLDVYYNTERLHSSINYRSPVDCERMAA